VSGRTASYGLLLAILERGDHVPVLTFRDRVLIEDALVAQSRRLASVACSKAYSGPAQAVARARLRERSERLGELSIELGLHRGLVLIGHGEPEAGQ
jgi:hypothetical protein